jgi:hypothetical protein
MDADTDAAIDALGEDGPGRLRCCQLQGTETDTSTLRQETRQSEVRTKSTPLFSDRDNCFEKSRSSLRGG